MVASFKFRPAHGAHLTRVACDFFGLERYPGPKWWPRWPLRESDKKLRARCRAVFSTWGSHSPGDR